MRVDLRAALTTVALSVSPPPTQPPAPPDGVQGKPFTYPYPFALPEGGGGVSGVAINSRGHLFVFQRKQLWLATGLYTGDVVELRL